MKEQDLENILETLRQKRPVFVSEADFQFALAWSIQSKFKNAEIRLEYPPEYDPNVHIDILVKIGGDWYPIELKYKTRKCEKEIDDETYFLKEHGATDVNCYRYLKDIERIQRFKKVPQFKRGFTIFLTNDLRYTDSPKKEDSIYKDFSLKEGLIKEGVLAWDKRASKGTMKGCEKPLTMDSKYSVYWKTYSQLDDSKTGTFKYLINTIEKE